MKIRNRILLLFIPAALAVFAIIAVTVYISSTKLITTLSSQLLLSTAITKAMNISTIILDQKQNTIDTAAASIFRDYLQNTNDPVNAEKVQKRLDRTITGNSNLIELYILDASGKVLISSDREEIGEDKSHENGFLQGKSGTFVDEIILYGENQKTTYAISSPITDDAATVLGVFLVQYNTNAITTVLKSEVPLGDTSDIFLVNKDFYLLTPSRYLGQESVLTKKVETTNVKNCFDPHEIQNNTTQLIGSRYIFEHVDHSELLQLKDYRGVDVTATHEYIPEISSCLIVKIDTNELIAPVISITSTISIVSIGGILIFIILSLIFSKQISSPIEKLRKGIEIVQQGNLNYIVGINSQDEIGQVSRSFDAMVDAVKEARKDVDRKVEEQTREIVQKSKAMEDQQKAILNILEDVEIEKKTAETLASDLSKFQLAVENASDHIVITDAEGLILYANKAVERITGFAPTDIIGKKAGGKELWGGLMEPPFYKLLWDTIKSEKKVFAGEIQNHRKNKEEYVAFASISPVVNRDGNVQFFVGIERDVTKEKEIDRMKTEFISLASHQLRTPLSAMKWFGEMLLAGDAGELTKDQKEYVTNIYDSNERMIGLVNSLLNISRIESGRLVIDPKPTDMKKLIDEIIVEVTPALKERELECIVSVHEHLPLISIDPKLLRQVYMNLLTNAIKYSPKGGTIQIFLSKKDDQLLSQVTDTGYGIPKEEQEHVFQKFFRAKNIVKMETEGTGLGLYLVKSIIDSSGGKIWFSSGEGGTTFWFSLPMSGMKAKAGEVTLEQKTIDGYK